MKVAQWRAHLRGVLDTFRWRLFGVRESDYHCLTIQIPVDDNTPTEGQNLTLREVLRGRKGVGSEAG